MLVSVVLWRVVNEFGHRMRVKLGSDLLDDGVEAIVIVGRVLDDPDATVGLVYAVGSVHYVTVSNFVLRFDVTGVGVVHAVVERVLGVGLKQ